MPDHVNLGRSGLRVSRLGLGTFNFGHEVIGCDEATSVSIVHAYLDAGYNYIDTANIYGGALAETYVGKAIKGRREDVVLATKAGGVAGNGPHDSGASRKALYSALAASLRRLETDYIDLYQLHLYDYNTPLEETLSTLNDFVRQGRVRHVGVCNWNASQITDAMRLCERHRWEAPISLQVQYNLLQRDIEVEVVGVCRKFGIAVLPWSPLAGSLLTGKYRRGQDVPPGGRLAVMPAMARRLTDETFDVVDALVEEAERLGSTPIALSLAWLLQKPGVIAPLIGPEDVSQLQENLAALDTQLPEETIARLDRLAPPTVGYPNSFGRPRQL